ncbi:MAG: PAS domain-containing protein [Opitutales bacterium]|nr:PAS domain-containing protein [Opitutales bacterium]MCH8541126.1 PAS domain-containing protein [Opitutales bacterium]
MEEIPNTPIPSLSGQLLTDYTFVSTKSLFLVVSRDDKEKAKIKESLRKAFPQCGIRFLKPRANSTLDDLPPFPRKVPTCVLFLSPLPLEFRSRVLQELRQRFSGVPLLFIGGRNPPKRIFKPSISGVEDWLEYPFPSVEGLQKTIHLLQSRQYRHNYFNQEIGLFHLLADNIPDRIYFKDARSRFVRINTALAKAFGLKDPSQAVGKTDFDFFTKEHAKPAFEDEKKILRTGKPLLATIEKETYPDGRVGWVNTTKMPIFNTDRKVIGTMGISRDITHIVHMEEKLEREHNLLKAIIDTLPDKIFVKDEKGHYLMSNPAHLKANNLENEKDVKGKTAKDLFPKKIAEKFHEDDLTLLRKGVPLINVEEKITDNKGRETWSLTSKVPFRGKGETVRGLVGISRDITDRKHAEQKLLEAKKALEEKEQKLRNALDNLRSMQMQLIESEKLKSLGRVAAGVAHEVKNPLGVLSMGMEYLKTKIPENTQLQEVFTDMAEAIDKANQVILEMLDFASPKELDLEPNNLNHIIEKSLLLLRHTLRKANIKVSKSLAQNLPPVKVDPNKIDQVFVNIIINSMNAMPDGGALKIKSFRHRLTGIGSNVASERPGSFRVGDELVTIQFEDTGIGIPEEKIAKVCEPFYTSQPTGKGTGLGLSVCRSILDLHHAIFTIENRSEGGVRVSISFRATTPKKPT